MSKAFTRVMKRIGPLTRRRFALSSLCAYMVLSVSTVLLWARSYYVGDRWFWAHGDTIAGHRPVFEIRVYSGSVAVGRMATTWMGTGIWHADGDPLVFASDRGNDVRWSFAGFQHIEGRK